MTTLSVHGGASKVWMMIDRCPTKQAIDHKNKKIYIDTHGMHRSVSVSINYPS